MQAVLDGVSDLSRVWPWYFGNRIRLPDHEEILDFTQVVSRLPFRSAPNIQLANFLIDAIQGSAPNGEEIGGIRFVAEKWGPHEIIV